MERDQGRFVSEDGLKALPTMATVLADPGQFAKNPESGIDWKRVVHGEQSVVIHKPLPAAGTAVGCTVIEEIVDKGAGKGALLYSRRDVRDKETGELLASPRSTTLPRPPRPVRAPPPPPP